MIKLLFPLPRKLTVAVSGGVDSVAVVDFLSNNHSVNCAFFHHGTESSDKAMNFVIDFCRDRNLLLHVGKISNEKPKDKSLEEHWRHERYKFLHSLDSYIVTAHHLNDCVETYIWSSLHGSPKTIARQKNNVYRPFLTTEKEEFVNWCVSRRIDWCEDTTNKDTRFTRNYIRQEMMPHVLRINPGINKVVKKMIES